MTLIKSEGLDVRGIPTRRFLENRVPGCARSLWATDMIVSAKCLRSVGEKSVHSQSRPSPGSWASPLCAHSEGVMSCLFGLFAPALVA